MKVQKKDSAPRERTLIQQLSAFYGADSPDLVKNPNRYLRMMLVGRRVTVGEVSLCIEDLYYRGLM